MGTGWRRAFCTSIPNDPETPTSEKHQTQSLKTQSSSGLCSPASIINPSTPRLRCRTTTATLAATPTSQDSPRLQCKTILSKSPRLFLQTSNPSSPRSPSSLFTTLFKSRSGCGICLESVKTGQGTAIFTAECAHTFHFPCIAAHVSKLGALVCPVCSTTWKDAPLLSIHKTHHQVQRTEHKNQCSTTTNPDGEKSKPPTSISKLYNDDEPLVSPKGSTPTHSINPIPEINEDDPDDAEVSQGFFFTNPSQPLKSDAPIDGSDLNRLETFLLPDAAVVSKGRTYEGYALILKVKAARFGSAEPLLDPSRRAPIDLVTVLDVSGSMTGDKLQLLKSAMRLVVGSLGSSDRLSIVAFSAGVKRLLPLTRMTARGQRSARRIVDRLACGQGSCVGDALRKAMKVLEDRRERNPVASIILLSDGRDERSQHNAADPNRPFPRVSSTRFAHLEVPVRAFGYGAQEDLHVPVVDAFAKCVLGLLSVVAQDVRLELGISSGSAPGEISAVYSINGRPSFVRAGSIRLGDLHAEEERELVVEMRVPTCTVGAHHVMSVKCSYIDPTTEETVRCREQVLHVPRPQVVQSSNPKIEWLRNLFITTKAIAEAKRQQDLARAFHMLSSAHALLESSSISADENLRVLDCELATLNQSRQQNLIQRTRIADQEASGEPLTPRSAGRAAEQLAKVAMMRKSLNRVSDLHGFENARF